MGVILLIVIFVLVLGGLPQLGLHAYGYGPSGIGLVLILVLLYLVLHGRL
jgi:hypothetical protein